MLYDADFCSFFAAEYNLDGSIRGDFNNIIKSCFFKSIFSCVNGHFNIKHSISLKLNGSMSVEQFTKDGNYAISNIRPSLRVWYGNCIDSPSVERYHRVDGGFLSVYGKYGNTGLFGVIK